MQEYRAILSNVTFHEQLWKLDSGLARRRRDELCDDPSCGGPLHVADIPRKPRGIGRDAESLYSKRLSFCCARCRRRATPASVRFLDGRVYVAAVVLLIAVATHGLTERRVSRLREILPIDRRTLDRWREWWADSFPFTPFWKAVRARFGGHVRDDSIPFDLMACFSGSLSERLLCLLRLLSPFPIPT